RRDRAREEALFDARGRGGYAVVPRRALLRARHLCAHDDALASRSRVVRSARAEARRDRAGCRKRAAARSGLAPQSRLSGASSGFSFQSSVRPSTIRKDFAALTNGFVLGLDNE